MKSREALIRLSNELGESCRIPGAPLLRLDSSRETLLEWLQWNDRNGAYTDAETASEDLEPMTLEQAWEALQNTWKDDHYDA